MGKDHQPKHRQVARDLKRRAAVRQAHERLLIVCEGEKTEPQYLRDLLRTYRLASAHVQVLACGHGTAPLQVVDYAERLFRKGAREKGIQALAFDRIAVVFDRDEHTTFHAALNKAAALNGSLRNDEKQGVPFDVIASVPCFELWLLLHFEDVQAPLSAREAQHRLLQHLPGYAKGGGGHWAATQAHLAAATGRALRLAAARDPAATATTGAQPYTAMHELVSRLVHLKD